MSEDPDCLDQKDNRGLLITAIAKLRSLIGTANEIAEWVKEERADARRILHLLESKPPIRLALGIVFKVQSGEIVMSGTSTTWTLTNIANPAAATRLLAAYDLSNVGTSALPTVTVSDSTKLTAVAATWLDANGRFVVGYYPCDASAEANDTVTGTVTLADGNTLVENFVISGTPVPPPAESISEDASSSVGDWTNAPAIPSTPV